jgi:hypothetical protein
MSISNHPEYITQSQFDQYAEKKIDYKEIFRILSNFKKHRLAPREKFYLMQKNI